MVSCNLLPVDAGTHCLFGRLVCWYSYPALRQLQPGGSIARTCCSIAWLQSRCACIANCLQATAGSMGAGGLLLNTASMHGMATTSLAQPSKLLPAKLDFADLTSAAEASNLMPAVSIDSRSRVPSDLAAAGDGGGEYSSLQALVMMMSASARLLLPWCL